MFKVALQHAKKDLDIVNIVTTLRKLKAGLSTVIANNQQQVDESKKIFYQESIINEKDTHSEYKNLFLDFLENDEMEQDRINSLYEKTNLDVLQKMKTKLNKIYSEEMVQRGCEHNQVELRQESDRL